MTAASHYVSEPAVHHTFIYGEVNNGLFLSVIDTGEPCLLRLPLDYLYLFHDIRRKVLCRKLRVIEEEGLAVDSDLVDSLAVCSHSTV